jgi:hypothetical protein
MDLTLAFITGRHLPQWWWLRDSFAREADRYGLLDMPSLVIVNANARQNSRTFLNQKFTPPKPNIWQGQYRVTSRDWWAVSAAQNTAICLCQTEWICFFDDRCVLLPGYLDALEAAMDGNYALAGAYEKRTGMTVEDGVIRHCGIVVAEDGRGETCRLNGWKTPYPCGGEWLFGANFACPLEWLLECNGVPEICDGQSFQDVQLGLLLQHNGHEIRYDPRAKIIEDRSPELCGPTYRREDKGVSPNDKSHALLAKFNNPKAKRAIHTPGWEFDIRKVRTDVLAGKPFPVPPDIEFKDWWDGQPIKDFK